MPPETLFAFANPLAMIGWLVLGAAPLAPRSADVLAGFVIPGVLCLGYSVVMMVHFADAPGGFQSLGAVQALFTDADVALPGWAHFLAFDLFIGGWVVRDARQRRIEHWVILPILAFVFLVGPAGLLAYMTLVLLWRVAPTAAKVA